MTLFGHERVRARLEAHLPPVSLLVGPPSVGKRTLALHVLQHHGAHTADIRFVEKLSADESRDLKRFCATAPLGKLKAVVARVDGASDVSLNALLKLLEEPPDTARFLLLSTHRPLATIWSRSEIYRLGLLRDSEVERVLVEHVGMEAGMAARAAVLARGRVSAALTVGDAPAGRSLVLSVLKAVRDSDQALFDQAVATWDEAAHELLVAWASEAATGQWRLFTEAETFGLAGTSVPLRLLRGLRLRARPKLAVRAAVEPLVQPV